MSDRHDYSSDSSSDMIICENEPAPKETQGPSVMRVGFSNPPVEIIRSGGGKTTHKSLGPNWRRKLPSLDQLMKGEPADESSQDSTKSSPEKRPSTSGEPAAIKKRRKAVVPNKLVSSDETKWQMVMDMAVNMLTPLKVDLKDLTMLADQGTLECFQKAAQAWMTERKIYTPLTYSTQKTLLSLMGRFLFHFIMTKVGESDHGGKAWPKNTNVSGAVVWKHQSGATLSCLHGLTMLNKEQIVEMDVSSENGQRALKETPEKTKITTNRWGRNVVQVRNEDAMCCQFDAPLPANNFSTKSCGMFYSEGEKAKTAFKQIMALQRACYPKMDGEQIVIPIKCDCNWASTTPLLGRQVCKVTPFTISATESIDRELVQDPKILATVHNPAVLVFQCCNPVYRNSRANPQKNCDWKISAPDVMTALQLAKQMWQHVFKEPPVVRIPEFKWSAAYQYQNTILPTGVDDTDDSLF
ncbi:DBP [Tree shrew adenovirus 1]|uniref:DBP n=1 Tax=Tree shrew adenovirus serotype 1 TaxID=47680 RepID=UPI00001D97A6|nr:DBP [Tree shrew adenovirus 1]